MNLEQMRQALLAAYPGPTWANRVKNMTEGQVFAVYTRLKNNNKI